MVVFRSAIPYMYDLLAIGYKHAPLHILKIFFTINAPSTQPVTTTNTPCTLVFYCAQASLSLAFVLLFVIAVVVMVVVVVVVVVAVLRITVTG